MAKHAKPTQLRTLSTTGARSAATLTMATAGLLATTPVALASGGPGDDHHDDVDYRWSNEVDAHESQGIVNVADNTVAVPIQACHNDVPVNVAGVQVPIQDAAATVSVGSNGDGRVAVSPDSCQQAEHQPD